MRERKKKTLPLGPIAIGAGVVILILVLVLTLGHDAGQDNSEALEAGIDYLESLEQKDPDAVRQVRKAIYQRELEEKREELRIQLTDGTIDPFTMFKDYVIMGDSRSVGFWYHNFLDKDRILADGGNIIRNVPSQIDHLVELNPSTIYLCYGLNDCSIGIWNSGEEYAAEYMEIVGRVKAKLPDTTIVVSSILPAKDPAFNRSSRWYDIPEWNIALEAACKENGVLFANNDQLAVDYPDYWDPDGIHFRGVLYPYWAANLVLTALMGEE